MRQDPRNRASRDLLDEFETSERNDESRWDLEHDEYESQLASERNARLGVQLLPLSRVRRKSAQV